MSFSGSYYKTPCWCTTPPLAYGSDVGLPQYYANIVVAGYWYSTPPQLYTALGDPMNIVSFSANFGNLSYYYKVYTKNILGDVGLTKSNEREVLCRNMKFSILTHDDVMPQVYHRDSNIQFRVTRIKRDAGKTLWSVQGCKI